MSATASRFGNSLLMMDWSGLTPHLGETAAEQRPQIAAKWDQTIAKLRNRTSGFYDCPVDANLSQDDACVALAEKINSTGKIKNCIFIGIGGSRTRSTGLIESKN